MRTGRRERSVSDREGKSEAVENMEKLLGSY
jgi:hypothetical protein